MVAVRTASAGEHGVPLNALLGYLKPSIYTVLSYLILYYIAEKYKNYTWCFSTSPHYSSSWWVFFFFFFARFHCKSMLLLIFLFDQLGLTFLVTNIYTYISVMIFTSDLRGF